MKNMKKNVLYAFGIALLFVMPIKSMEQSFQAEKLEWLKSKATPQELMHFGRFKTAIENKNWKVAQQVIQNFEKTRQSTTGPIPVLLDEKIAKMKAILQDASGMILKPSIIKPQPASVAQIKPGTLEAITILNCQKTSIKYFVKVIRNNSHIYTKEIKSTTGNSFNIYPVKIALQEGDWISIKDSSKQAPHETYKSIQEYRIKNGQFEPVLDEEGNYIELYNRKSIANINITNDVINLVIDCSNGTPIIKLEKK